MSAKLLRQLRPWTSFTSSTSRAQLDPNQSPPTTAAEAQDMMFKMREEALTRVSLERKSKISQSSEPVHVESNPDDQDNDLDFPSVTREELLSRCEEELQTMGKPFERKFNVKDSTKPPNTIRILQWNILSQTLGEMNDNFILCHPSALDWNTRRWRIIAEIIRYDPDVVFLQEVDHYKLIQKALGSIRYCGRFIPKPDSPCIHLESNNGPDGCAIFYKKSKFDRIHMASKVLKVWGAPSNQVVLSLILKHKQSKEEICVATTHFKAKFGSLQSSFRNEQGKDLLEWLEEVRGGKPVIVGGDFNGEPSEPFHATLTDNTTIPLETAYEIHEEKDGDNGSYTTWKIRDTGDHKNVLDYIFHSPQLKIVSTLDMPTEEQIGNDRLPSLQFPSDHMSLIADINLSYL